MTDVLLTDSGRSHAWHPWSSGPNVRAMELRCMPFRTK